VIAVSESTAPLRPSPLFVQGQASVPLVEALTARVLDLKDGQTVQATVQSQGEQMALMLRGRQIGVPRNAGWEVGQRLNFQVQSQADGSVLLQLLPAPFRTSASPLANPGAPAPTVLAGQASPPTAGAAPAAAAPAVTALVPLDAASQAYGAGGLWAPFAGFSGTFSRLGSLLYRKPGQPDVRALFTPGSLDALLAKADAKPEIQVQWQAMQLSTERISPEAIRMAVLAAMGSETSLSRVRNPSPLDPKQMLQQILKSLTEVSEEDSAEVQQVKRALGDLDAAQLSAVQAQGNAALAMAVVLPFVNHEPVELVFERPAREGDQESVFTVSAHSNSQDYGELWLKADLHANEQVDLSMWAVRESVLELARTGADQLRLNLQDAGLSMRSFQAIAGPRPNDPSPVKPLARPGEVLDFRV